MGVKTLSSGSRTICSTTNVNYYLKRKVKNMLFHFEAMSGTMKRSYDVRLFCQMLNI